MFARRAKDSGKRKMDCVAKRTRKSWDDFYSGLKRKNKESGGVGGRGKRTARADSLGNSGECTEGEARIEPCNRGDISVDPDSCLDARNSRDSLGNCGECSDREAPIESLGRVIYVDSDGCLHARNSPDILGNSGECSEGEVPIEPLNGDISVDSDSSMDSRNSTEDSDDSDFESSSEEEGGLSDNDYKGGGALSSESSGDSYYSSGDELVTGVGGNENIMKGGVENLSDTNEDTNGVSTGRNLREEQDKEQEKHDESDEDDEKTGHCNIRSDQKNSDDGIIAKEKEKSARIRKSERINLKTESGADLERYFKIDKEKKNLHSVRHIARKNQKIDGEEEPELGKCSFPMPNKSAYCGDNEDEHCSDFTLPETKGKEKSVKKEISRSRTSLSARNLDSIKILLDSLNSVRHKQCTLDENALPENAPSEYALPLKFRFEDEVVPPPEKSDWEKHIASLFHDLELGLCEAETDSANSSEGENEDLKTSEKIDESPSALCQRGKHDAILDEQIGILCRFCHTVIMEIRHVLPPFHIPNRSRKERIDYNDELPNHSFSGVQFQGSAPTSTDSTSCTKGTVWDLVPGVKKELYPHQCEGFEFMWRNIAGDTIIENLKHTLADDARGCIISHAPGTGKTRLTIVFLQSFLKLYPACSPLIIAPFSMLLAWEAEFKKWNFNAAFHILNKKGLSGNESTVATELLGHVGSGVMSKDCIRLLKLYSWAKGGSVLGMSYKLFEQLAGGKSNKHHHHEQIRQVLLERPGLLVLDEGHTPRNHASIIWKALTKVSTQRRIILSGTPFQNSLKELYNTLCVVNPKFAVSHQSDTNCKTFRRWRNLTHSFGIKKGDALQLRAVLDPFVHVYKGTILEESLPGLMHTLIFLHPTESQKILLEIACKEKEMFRRDHMVSLVSLHPSIDLVTKSYSYSTSQSKQEGTKLDVDDGVKLRFLIKLIRFSDALGERVLVFSQYIDSLVFIKGQLESIFSWHEGREVLYMDGKLDDRKRQDSISSLNNEKSEVKVLLASLRACSEGINLVGASRVVLLDTVWNPSVEKQAISRAYRLGQRKVVYVYRLFTAGVEDRQYAHQLCKERISQWIFSLGGQACLSQNSRAVSEDKVLAAMLEVEDFRKIFEKVISQPKESDLVKTFVGL